MAEDTTNPFASFMGLLDKKKGAKGVVRKDSDKVNPTLTSEEKARYTNIFTIMKDVVNPKAEAERIGGTTAATVGGTTAMAAQAKAAGGDGFNVAKLLGGAALALGGIFAGLATMLEEEFDKFSTAVFDFGGAVAADIGTIGALALKVGGKLGSKLKFLPLIGSLVNFGLAWDHFRNNRYFDATYELVSGLVPLLLPGLGMKISMGMDLIRTMYDFSAPVDEDGNKTIDFGPWLLQKSKEMGQKVFQAVKAGKVPIISGLFKFGEAIGEFIAGNPSEGMKKMGMIIPAMLGQGDNEAFLMAFDAFTTILGESTYQAYTKGKEMVGDAWGWMKGVFTKIGESIKRVYDAVIDFVNETIDKGIKAITDLIPGPVKKLFESGGSNNLDATYTPPSGSSTGYYAPFSHMQDGMISKDGKVTTFDDEDDLLAAKKGGPIDRLLDGNSAMMKSVAAINAKQLSVLVEIRDGIRALSNTGPQFNNNNLTSEFYA